MNNLLQDLLWLVYPHPCAACDRPLMEGEDCICTSCRFHLPQTRYHKEPENPVEKHFWGRIPVAGATAFFHFSKGERVQRLIHRLKYKDWPEIGRAVGSWMGHELISVPAFSVVDLILPVPLHPRRRYRRGYNQSALLAEGLAASLGKPWGEMLERNVATSTQTRKHRYERYENVNRVFQVKQPGQIEGRHILLVDDVITTGSTLVSCAEMLLEIPGTRISIAAMACA